MFMNSWSMEVCLISQMFWSKKVWMANNYNVYLLSSNAHMNIEWIFFFFYILFPIFFSHFFPLHYPSYFHYFYFISLCFSLLSIFFVDFFSNFFLFSIVFERCLPHFIFFFLSGHSSRLAYICIRFMRLYTNGFGLNPTKPQIMPIGTISTLSLLFKVGS